MNIPKQQTEIFHQQGAILPLAELSNALYTEALRQLSQTPWLGDIALLQRRLGSLPGHVQRTAHALLFSAEQISALDKASELRLDIHNGQWVAKQAPRNPAGAALTRTHTLSAWLQQHVQLATVLPVLIQHGLSEQLVLDSVDEIVFAEQRLHLNQWGWFNFAGQPISDSECAYFADGEAQPRALLKPSPSLMRAACCGHRWGPNGKLLPQPLSLRSLLLTATLSWPGFRTVQKLPF